MPPHLHSFPTRRSSDLRGTAPIPEGIHGRHDQRCFEGRPSGSSGPEQRAVSGAAGPCRPLPREESGRAFSVRSEEHTSELQSVKISYAVFCLKKKNIKD